MMELYFILKVFMVVFAGQIILAFLESMINDIRNGRRDNFFVGFLYFRMGWFKPFFDDRLKKFKKFHPNWRTARLGIR